MKCLSIKQCNGNLLLLNLKTSKLNLKAQKNATSPYCKLPAKQPGWLFYNRTVSFQLSAKQPGWLFYNRTVSFQLAEKTTSKMLLVPVFSVVRPNFITTKRH
jgi:hypothetical protein